MSELRREEHAISEEVWNSRPYVRYEPDDRDAVRAEYGSSYMTGLAGQCGGYLMMRHPPPGLRLGHVDAEIRPDAPVWSSGGYWHYHPTTKPPADFVPMIPERDGKPEKPLSSRYVSTFAAMKRAGHIDRDKGNPYDHRGVNNEDVHFHRPQGRYMFRPGPGARRLDVHPLAAPLFDDAEVVFFAIEGVVKADAILTAILASGIRAAVFSVPSVTLWRAPELERFARKSGKPVVIVPDGDWRSNPLVITQALCCRTQITGFGLQTCVAAPTRGKGVDDHLYHGGTLEELEVVGRDFPNLFGVWRDMETLYARNGGLGREDKIARNFAHHVAAAVHASEAGTLQKSLRSLARILDVPEHRLRRAVHDLVDAGAWEADRPLETVRGVWKGRYFDRSEQWDGGAPIFTIRPELRATTTDPVPLTDYLKGSV